MSTNYQFLEVYGECIISIFCSPLIDDWGHSYQRGATGSAGLNACLDEDVLKS